MSARAPAGDFSRTLQTAADATGVARLLDRAAERAKKVGCYGDAARLRDLAQRYVDYAAALRETAAETVEEPPADQMGLAL